MPPSISRLAFVLSTFSELSCAERLHILLVDCPSCFSSQSHLLCTSLSAAVHSLDIPYIPNIPLDILLAATPPVDLIGINHLLESSLPSRTSDIASSSFSGLLI